MAMRSVGTARAIDALPALPGAERELAALAAAIGADGSQLLIGADATEGRLSATPIPSGAVLAFATHELLSGELGGLHAPAPFLTRADGAERFIQPPATGAPDPPTGPRILSRPTPPSQ